MPPAPPPTSRGPVGKRDAIVDLAERQRDPEVGKVEASIHVLDHVLHPAPLRVPRPVDHLGRVGFDENDVVETRDRFVFSDLLDGVEIPRSGRQDLDYHAGCSGLEPVRVAMPAIHSEIGPADLTWQRLDAAVARERPAGAAAQLVSQRDETVHDDVVMHVSRIGHHLQRPAVDEFVALALSLLPSEEGVHGPGLQGGFGHGLSPLLNRYSTLGPVK